MNLTITGASDAAVKAVEAAGGSVAFVERVVKVTLGQLQKAVEAQTLDASQPIDADALIAAKVIQRRLSGVRLVAQGRLRAKISLTVAAADADAVKAVETAGGSVTVAR